MLSKVYIVDAFLMSCALTNVPFCCVPIRRFFWDFWIHPLAPPPCLDQRSNTTTHTNSKTKTFNRRQRLRLNNALDELMIEFVFPSERFLPQFLFSTPIREDEKEEDYAFRRKRFKHDMSGIVHGKTECSSGIEFLNFWYGKRQCNLFCDVLHKCPTPINLCVHPMTMCGISSVGRKWILLLFWWREEWCFIKAIDEMARHGNWLFVHIGAVTTKQRSVIYQNLLFLKKKISISIIREVRHFKVRWMDALKQNFSIQDLCVTQDGTMDEMNRIGSEPAKLQRLLQTA